MPRFFSALNRGRRISRARWRGASACALLLLASGCQSPPPATYAPPMVMDGFVTYAPANNPLVVPVLDRDLLWEQLVDVMDDYFRIAREERVQLVGDQIIEGRLETYPRGASTLLEPWNKDSVDFYERLESTLQSMRRFSVVRVTPEPNGYAIDVQVYKELEDVARPESGLVSQVNSQALRNDDSLVRVTNPVGGAQPTLGWIPKGRDVALEQTILAHLRERLGGNPRPY